MKEHDFVLSQGEWLGEGSITLSMVEEPIKYLTKWKVGDKDTAGLIECMQEVQLKGLQDVMVNQFSFFEFNSNSFQVLLENNTLGKVQGKGIVSPQVFGWEFKVPEIGFQGFEFYEKQQGDLYLVHAEYTSNDDYRTIIKGKIWKAVK